MSVRSRFRRPVWLGSVRRTGPLSENWGRERGTPLDRWYIEGFLADHADDIHGKVLEVMDDAYTRRLGRSVHAAEVLDVDPGNPRATLVADLERAADFPADTYDCFVLTQTLQFVYDVRAAVASVHRTLRPGGVCLATVPVVSRLDRAGIPRGEFWRITPVGCERLFAERFGAERVEVTRFGNTLTCIGFLLGLAAQDLRPSELEAVHPFFPLLVGVRAVKR